MNIVQWIKNNVVAVVSIAVVIVSIVILIWTQMQGGALREEVEAAQRQLQNIKGMQNQTVVIPAPNPDAPPQQIRGRTINEAVRSYISNLYEGIRGEHDQLKKIVMQRNLQGHDPLVQGLWENPDQLQNPAIRIQARVNYRQALQDMLGPASADAKGPRLAAGRPPTQERIQRELQNVVQSFNVTRAGVNAGNTRDRRGYAQPTPRMPQDPATARAAAEAEQKRLFETQRNQLVELLRSRASDIQIYAATDIRDPLFPFQVAPWSNGQAPPTLYELWEGQLELWIQQDIARAIAKANNVSDPSTSVVDNPVKRLLSVRVWPGYVGLHTAGAVATGGTAPNALPYPAPVRGMLDLTAPRQPDNFAASPTGRVSNALYDVRHATIEAIVDVSQLPSVFKAIHNTNLMTVLKVQLQDVDEYDALQEGYFYGSGDVALATIVVESIWLRDFTRPKMPSIVRQYVGLDDPVDLTPTQGGDMMYGDPYGGYGGYGDPYGMDPYGEQ